LAARTTTEDEADISGRIQRLYELTFGRQPDATELSLALEFVQASANEEEATQAWNRLAQALLMTNEFVFID